MLLLGIKSCFTLIKILREYVLLADGPKLAIIKFQFKTQQKKAKKKKEF